MGAIPPLTRFLIEMARQPSSLFDEFKSLKDDNDIAGMTLIMKERGLTTAQADAVFTALGVIKPQSAGDLKSAVLTEANGIIAGITSGKVLMFGDRSTSGSRSRKKHPAPKRKVRKKHPG